MDRPLEDRADVLPVLGQGSEGEVTGDAIELPDLAPGFEEADHQLAGLLLEVGVPTGVADRWHPRGHPVDRSRHEVEVLACLQRNVHPDAGRQLSGPHAGAEHDRFGLDGAEDGVHPGGAIAIATQSRDLHTFEDPYPAILGALRQGHGGVHGARLSVAGDVDRADQIIGAEQGPVVTDLVQIDDVCVDPDRLRHRCSPE